MRQKVGIRFSEWPDVTKAVMDVMAHNFTRTDVFQTCLTCNYWENNPENCKKYNQRPPAHVIVNACPDYQDENEIPR